MAYDTNNIFAKILREELPCKKIYEDDYVLAFEDIAPAAPVHVLVIPKAEYISFHDFVADAPPEMVTAFFTSMQKIAAMLHLEQDGYRIVANHGKNAGQLVPHFHMHILAGKNLGGLLAK